MGSLSVLSRLAELFAKVRAKPKELPPGYIIKEFTPMQREAIDEIIGPLRAVGSKVDPDDRDIFTAMRNTFKVNPDARTRFLFTPEGRVAGGYQLATRGAERYIPNVAVSEQGKGYGSMLMNHAMSTKEAPTFLVSAPGKEGFYRKMGMKETVDPDTDVASFRFRRGGLIQMKECSCGR